MKRVSGPRQPVVVDPVTLNQRRENEATLEIRRNGGFSIRGLTSRRLQPDPSLGEEA